MLVVTRKLNEKLHLGNDITITIVRVSGGSVRLGIEAPKHVNVFRGEAIEGIVNDKTGAKESSDG